MSFLLLAVIFPLFGALLLSVMTHLQTRQIMNLLFSVAGFLLTLIVWGKGVVDPLAAIFGALSGFVGVSVAVIDIIPVAGSIGKMPAGQGRFYHVLFQILLSASLMGLYVNNICLLWVALAIETIAVALGISLKRTKPSLKAAWSYILFNSVGLGLALFGTLLLSLAAETAAGTNFQILGFTALSSQAVNFNQSWLSLAFMLIIFGYGIKAVLTPIHDWVSETYAEGPIGLTCILRGLSTNVVLLAILRFRHIVKIHENANLPADILLSVAIVSICLSTIAVLRQNNVRRFLGGIASGQASITLFAFGVGGTAAIFAGVLQMVLWALLRSGLFFVFARASQDKQGEVSFRSMPKTNKYATLVFGLALFATSCLPPSGFFVSEFTILGQTALYSPWICLPLFLALLVYVFLTMRHVGDVLFAHTSDQKFKIKDRWVNLSILYLGLFLVFAYAMPSPLHHALIQAVEVWQ